MKYDDLINVPYKVHGRGRDGMDCYGVIIECAKRYGKPIADVDSDGMDSISVADAERYVKDGLHLTKATDADVGTIVECEYEGNLHCGYVVERGKVLHATKHGVKVSPLGALKVTGLWRAEGI